MAERRAFVLVHSPIVGPDTWEPVAQALRHRDIAVTVPELIDDGAPPFWRQHTRCVVRDIAEHVAPGLPLVLVAHSAAGQLLGVVGPVLRDAGYHVHAEILADAGLPPAGRSRIEQLDDDAPEFAARLRALLDDGHRYPNWTADDVAPLVPDEERRSRLLDQLRPPPPGYWVEPIPTSVDWPDAPVGALMFSSAYGPTVRAAREHGWPLRMLDGDNHLLLLADEERVVDELVALVDEVCVDNV